MSHTYQKCAKCHKTKRSDYFHKYVTKHGPVNRKICKKCGSDNAMAAAEAKANKNLQQLINWPDLCGREEIYG